jgi:hypothetical protein
VSSARCAWRTVAAQPAQVEHRVDLLQEMIWWNHIFEIKFIEKTVLPTNRIQMKAAMR